MGLPGRERAGSAPLADLPRKLPKREKHGRLTERALADLAPFAERVAP